MVLSKSSGNCLQSVNLDRSRRHTVSSPNRHDHAPFGRTAPVSALNGCSRIATGANSGIRNGRHGLPNPRRPFFVLHSAGQRHQPAPGILTTKCEPPLAAGPRPSEHKEGSDVREDTYVCGAVKLRRQPCHAIGSPLMSSDQPMRCWS
jgi:hypothetical protein